MLELSSLYAEVCGTIYGALSYPCDFFREREPEFIGGDVDLRINIYRNQSTNNSATNNAKINANGAENGVNVPTTKEQEQVKNLLDVIAQNPSATQAYYAERIGVSKRTVSRIFVSLQEKSILVQTGTKRKSNWVIKK